MEVILEKFPVFNKKFNFEGLNIFDQYYLLIGYLSIVFRLLKEHNSFNFDSEDNDSGLKAISDNWQKELEKKFNKFNFTNPEL